MSYYALRAYNSRTVSGAIRNLLGGNCASINHRVKDLASFGYMGVDFGKVGDDFYKLLSAKDVATLIYTPDNYMGYAEDDSDFDFLVIKDGSVAGYDYCEDRQAFSNHGVDLSSLAGNEKVSDPLDTLFATLFNNADKKIDRYPSDELNGNIRVLQYSCEEGAYLFSTNIAHFVLGEAVEINEQKFLELAGLDTEEKPATINNEQASKQVSKQTIKETEIMSKVNAVVSANKSAAMTAARLEAGNIALQQVSKLASKHLPLMLRGYADTPVGRIALANLMHFAVQQYAPSNGKAVMVSQAMMEAAMLEMVQSFNIGEMIDQIVNKVDIPDFSKFTKDAAEE